MNKTKKYIYPIVFSIIYIIFYAFLVMVLNAVLDNGSYAGAACLIFAVALWAVFVIPFYCVKYIKIIADEKLKFLFIAYNSLLLPLTHALPFSLDADAYVYIGIFFLWVVLWHVIPLVIRALYRKTQIDPEAEEALYLANPLLQNKTKRIIAICFTSAYILRLISTSGFLKYGLLNMLLSALPVISAVLTLVFLLSKSKGYRLKKWLLPVAFGVELAYCLISVILSFNNMRYLGSNPLYIVRLVLSSIGCVAVVFVVLGTLADYKRIDLMKYGLLVHTVSDVGILVAVALELTSFIPSALIPLLIHILYYIGIFILTTNKRRNSNEYLA